MSERKWTDKRKQLWATAALASPIAHVASAMPWPITLLVVLLAAGVRSIWGSQGERTGLEKNVSMLISLLAAAEIMTWMGECWPEQPEIRWIMAILLGIAWVLCRKGPVTALQAGILLWWFVAFLLGSVLLSSLPEIKYENLKQLPDALWLQHPARLLILLLLPAALWSSEKEDRDPMRETGAMALAISLCSQGVLSLRIAARERAPFYELSRSIRFYGTFERMEAMAWLGLMLGTFITLSWLLSAGVEEDNRTWLIPVKVGITLSLYVLQAKAMTWILLTALLFLTCGKPAIRLLEWRKKKMEEKRKKMKKVVDK